MITSDLLELKLALEVDPTNTIEDAKLSLFIQWATEIIETAINRPGLMLKSRTEFYNGTGTPKLLLRHRPVYVTPAIQVWVDQQHGYYGSSEGSFDSDPLVYGQDFCLELYEEGQPSKNGILVSIRQPWPRPAVRQDGLLSPFLYQSFGNIKVTYSGGYNLDTLPGDFRMATVALVSKMRGFWPTGYELSSDGYIDKNISIIGERKDYLTILAKQLLWNYRNFRF